MANLGNMYGPKFTFLGALKGLEISAMITLACLFLFGFFKSKMTGVNPWLGGLKVTMIGALAAAAAFGIAKAIGAGH